MIILADTNDSLEIVLTDVVTANQLPFVASWVDVTTTTYVPGQTNGTSNSTTAVTVVAAPGASTQRQVKFFSIYNADTLSAEVTVRLNDNATTRIITKTTLAIGDTLMYNDGEGFKVIATLGGIRSTGAAAAGGAATGAVLNELLLIGA